MNSNYNGKVVVITEANDENPIVITVDSSDHQDKYDGTASYQKLFGKSILFDGTFESLKYESVYFIWIWDASTGSGKWIPMR